MRNNPFACLETMTRQHVEMNAIKKILVIGFSQTGQLRQILDAIESPLQNQANVQLTRKAITPELRYNFPWSIVKFFDVFPECVHLDAPKNKPLELEDYYDLVILGYQPWFLSPSLPTTAFLKSKTAQEILKNTPVITVIGCRNMWVKAQASVVKMLDDVDAKLIDNVVLIDGGSALATFITTPRWLLTGKKNSFWGLPEAGISKKDIQNATRFGRAILSACKDNHPFNQPILSGLKAVKINTGLLQSEKIGYRSFFIWGKLLRFVGRNGSWRRKPILLLYIVFLITMIVTIVPVNLLFRFITKPFLRKKMKQLEQQFELPSGSGDFRMRDFL